MEIIQTQPQLAALARRLGVRRNWHEPDEQDVTARVEGDQFDNAGFWPAGNGFGAQFYGKERTELHVIVSQHGMDVAAINLATLLAFACGAKEV